MIELLNDDCMNVMAKYPDKYFDLTIVDPEYGIGEDGKSNHSRGNLAKPNLYKPKDWDKQPPPTRYFNELIRVSKNQIIFGANHFISRIPYDSSAWIVWDKLNGINDFADCELAWTSFKSAVRKFQFRWQGMLQGDMKNKQVRIHPTEKPVQLYKWILKNYAKPGDKIIDTHLGSGSHAIAVHEMNEIEQMNLSLVACEIDTDYFNDMLKRYKNATKQIALKF